MKISMITICRNSGNTIEKTIRSVLEQAYTPLEYIIVDGLSTDDTMQVVGRYADRIQTIVSEKDGGISDAFNKGIALATGELVGLINADDRLMPGALEAVARAIVPRTDVLFGDVTVDGGGFSFYGKADPDLRRLYTGMSLKHPAVFIRKKAYETYGGFDTACRYAMDRELLLRMHSGGAVFQYLNKPLACYSMGGVSDKRYLKYVLPETSRISRQYGAPWLKVAALKWAKRLRYWRFSLFTKLGLEKRLRRNQNSSEGTGGQ